VIIDDKLPITENGEFLFGKYHNFNEYFLPLFEKAYAKLFGSYDTLDGGYIEDFIMDTTGFSSYIVKLHDYKNIFPSRQIEKFAYFDKYYEKFENHQEWFWNYMIEMSNKSIMTV